MPQESYLERKLRQLGLSPDHSPTSNGSNSKRLTFRVYFPRPPYGSVEYLAAKQGDGLNFVGQLLGHGGSTLKRIQAESQTRVEVHDSKGNLNGTHPSYTDPSLHAIVFAETREKLNKAVKMISEVLSPINGSFECFEVVPNGSALLKPVLKFGSKGSFATESVSSNGGGTPLDDTEAFPALDSDNTSVPERSSSSSPWLRARPNLNRLESPLDHNPTKKKVDSQEVSNKEEIQRVKSWNTWGQNQQDAYSQFTALTQSLVSQYANQTRNMRWNFENQKNMMETMKSPLESNFHSFSQIRSPFGSISKQEIGTWVNVPESCPFPNLYEDLVNDERSMEEVEEEDSSLVNKSEIRRVATIDSNSTSKTMMKSNNPTTYQRISLPRNI